MTNKRKSTRRFLTIRKTAKLEKLSSGEVWRLSNNKKAAHRGQPVKRQGMGTLADPPIPFKDSITKSGGAQVTISEFLHPGRTNALPLRDLCEITGMDGRQVRLMIQRERLIGIPIISDNRSGYYLADSDWEITEFVRSMRHRAGEIMAVAQSVEKAAGLL